ncbi:MarR family winged helix-turn-helix transcriptional regulator [Sciscionella sediminilitoris]|uniref:MarR family winged helix-turn-helix transcriptional regulator n=1 Tax=Sciscionella sediminilitoris TaxID=1445613 RepID=UPI0009E9DBB9|nr:MarR family transcriptional regulator [Sciscionella sp. SE31]
MTSDPRSPSARTREDARPAAPQPEPGAVRPPTLLGIPSYLAGNIARAATRALAHSLEEHHLRLTDHAVLSCLADFGPMAQHEIADRLDVDRSQVVGFVDRLERNGLVTRNRNGPDRRRVLITITEEGVSAEREITEEAHRVQSALLEPLSPAERTQLVGLLQRVLDMHDTTRLGLANA